LTDDANVARQEDIEVVIDEAYDFDEEHIQLGYQNAKWALTIDDYEVKEAQYDLDDLPALEPTDEDAHAFAQEHIVKEYDLDELSGLEITDSDDKTCRKERNVQDYDLAVPYPTQYDLDELSGLEITDERLEITDRDDKAHREERNVQQYDINELSGMEFTDKEPNDADLCIADEFGGDRECYDMDEFGAGSPSEANNLDIGLADEYGNSDNIVHIVHRNLDERGAAKESPRRQYNLDDLVAQVEAEEGIAPHHDLDVLALEFTGEVDESNVKHYDLDELSGMEFKEEDAKDGMIDTKMDDLVAEMELRRERSEEERNARGQELDYGIQEVLPQPVDADEHVAKGEASANSGDFSSDSCPLEPAPFGAPTSPDYRLSSV